MLSFKKKELRKIKTIKPWKTFKFLCFFTSNYLRNNILKKYIFKKL